MICTGIVSYLLADTTLAGLVGNCIYPTMMPQNSSTFPAIVYTDVSANTDVNLDLTAVQFKRIQFDCRDISYLNTKTIQDRLHFLLDGFTGALPDGMVIKYVACGTDIDLYDKDSHVYRAVSDWTFQY
jgi:hypothetical protein